MVEKASGRIFKHYSAEPVLQKVAEAFFSSRLYFFSISLRRVLMGEAGIGLFA
jgi:hypothetical protein